MPVAPRHSAGSSQFSWSLGLSNGAYHPARPNLSEHTVRNYLIRIFDKLGISGRVELLLYALAPPQWLKSARLFQRRSSGTLCRLHRRDHVGKATAGIRGPRCSRRRNIPQSPQTGVDKGKDAWERVCAAARGVEFGEGPVRSSHVAMKHVVVINVVAAISPAALMLAPTVPCPVWEELPVE